eukprot:Amastigsp_a841036_357.p4 type:complete len:122 gc:universal Amastigsp_a841036_357:393-28(-)
MSAEKNKKVTSWIEFSLRTASHANARKKISETMSRIAYTIFESRLAPDAVSFRSTMIATSIANRTSPSIVIIDKNTLPQKMMSPNFMAAERESERSPRAHNRHQTCSAPARRSCKLSLASS